MVKEGVKVSNKLKKELKELCSKNLAVYSVPKDYEFRDTLPKTLLNKIDYKKLESEELERIKNKKDN